MLLHLYLAINLVLLAKAAVIDDDETIIEYLTTSEVNSSYIDAINGNVTTTTVRPTCHSDQWQCADTSCISLEHKCDGAFHCEDGSDETRANCRNTARHMLGLLFHCTADRWNLKKGVCPDICKDQMEYCGYALMAEQNPDLQGVCVLPDFVRYGNYKVIMDPKKVSESDFKDFAIEYGCDYGTELVGEQKVKCINGTWSTEMPTCSEACKLKITPEYKFQCRRDNLTKTCGEFVAIGTDIIVQKEDTIISNTTITAYAKCIEGKVLNVTATCVHEVETRQEKYEKDVMTRLSDFENKFKVARHPSFEFEELVSKYRKFESQVNQNSTDLKREVALCDIYLDLMEMSQETRTRT